MTTLFELLQQVQNRQCSIESALEAISSLPDSKLEEACIDHNRYERTGVPEVVYGASKSADQIIAISQTILERGHLLLVTRVDDEKAKTIVKELPDLLYHPKARILQANALSPEEIACRGDIVILSAGTSDIPVAEEAKITAESLGNPVTSIYDVGVAGLHRLLAHRLTLEKAKVIIVVAGMEGALPSVVAGLVKAPVIGVPTSVGYGANLSGFTPLFGMLTSCAPGLAVVNIDNGFGAGCMASSINRK